RMYMLVLEAKRVAELVQNGAADLFVADVACAEAKRHRRLVDRDEAPTLRPDGGEHHTLGLETDADVLIRLTRALPRGAGRIPKDQGNPRLRDTRPLRRDCNNMFAQSAVAIDEADVDL